MSTLSSVAVFCGSRFGADPAYEAAAVEVGRTLAERGITLVYGGGRVGLMGAVADAAVAAGGEVVGVIPRSLDEREVAHAGLSELHVVETMHERKAIMAERAQAFLALPGGMGTLEEITEQWTWTQLGIHAKRSAFYDVGGFWQPLSALVYSMVRTGFLTAEHSGLVSFDQDLDALLGRLAEPLPAQTKDYDARP
ncbi:MAG: TIGR00730 family Rossman fold protein [Aeromicrobium sp.]|uniref:LOG family protein n=1 Tax=Aeromicrobium sp. TaxID=1871063 RepID=UPI002637B04E|nr:TIGR00730 family Rossman fold protein [Aeromicrobium sp.]MDF1703185.1 TIGR00730 family Rossman fold protein [Aeromicrobium sp.]